MEQYFTKDYLGAPFELFGAAHLAALVFVAVVNILIIARQRAFTECHRRIFRYVLAATLVVFETSWHLWNYFTGQWTVQTMLPLHLCSALVWASAYMLLTRSYAVYEFAYFLGLAGAVQALVTPDAGIYGYPHFRFFQVILSHGSIFTAAIYMTFVEGYRPTWRSLRRVIVYGNLYALAVFGINLVLKSNYLFIMRPPDTPSLIDVLGPWPWYILSMEAIAMVLCLLLYLPYALSDRRKQSTINQPASTTGLSR
jgi:hypothetical integral membrane protein (TIGR02206 family)